MVELCSGLAAQCAGLQILQTGEGFAFLTGENIAAVFTVYFYEVEINKGLITLMGFDHS